MPRLKIEASTAESVLRCLLCKARVKDLLFGWRDHGLGLRVWLNLTRVLVYDLDGWIKV